MSGDTFGESMKDWKPGLDQGSSDPIPLTPEEKEKVQQHLVAALAILDVHIDDRTSETSAIAVAYGLITEAGDTLGINT